MRKKLDLTRYFLRQPGNRIAPYIQDGLEFDKEGISLRSFPEPKKIFLSQRRQSYRTIKAAEQALRLKRFNPDDYVIVPYKRGHAIKEK